MLERRGFLSGAAIGGAAVAAATGGFPKPALAQERREWRMVTAWPKGLPGVGTGAERLAANITTLSSGRLTVQVFAAGELVPGLGVLDAVSDGTAQLGHDASYYHIGKSIAAPFFTAFPWGLTAAELTAWIHFGGGQALWDELYDQFGIQAFLAGNTGTQMFGWLRKEITSLADIQGLKFRTPGIAGQIMTALGATVVVLAGGDIFQALQSGTVDGAEWIGPYNDLALGFYQVCPYYYAPGYQEPGAGLQLTVNKSAFAELPDDLQAIVRTAARAAHDEIWGEYNARSGPALRSLIQEHGVQLRSLPEEVLIATGREANNIILGMLDGDDDLVKRIARSYVDFRAEILPWTRVGEQSVYNARLLPFPFGVRE